MKSLLSLSPLHPVPTAIPTRNHRTSSVFLCIHEQLKIQMVVVVVVTVFHFFTKVGICMGLCIAFSVKTYRRSFQTTAFPHSFLELHFSPFCGYVVIYLTRTLTVQYGIFVKIMVHPIISSFLDSLLYRLLHDEFPAVRILSQSYSFEVL